MNVQRFLEIASRVEPWFGMFKDLRVGGKDEYSRMSLVQLYDLVSEDDMLLVEDQDKFDLKDKATAYRWIARGLSANHAIRKIEVDKEISGTVRKAREVDEFLDTASNQCIKEIMRGEITLEEAMEY